MGFVSGVITGVAAAAAGAAWYMSRSGERVREQYRVERRLGELGDQLEVRTREIQSQVNAQLTEMRQKAKEAEASANGHGAGALDEAKAAAAEAAAEAESTIESAAKAAEDAAG